MELLESNWKPAAGKVCGPKRRRLAVWGFSVKWANYDWALTWRFDMSQKARELFLSPPNIFSKRTQSGRFSKWSPFVWSTSFTSGASLTTTAFKLPICSCTTRPYSCRLERFSSDEHLTFWRAVNASNGTLLNLPRRCRLPMRGQGLRCKKTRREISFGKATLGQEACWSALNWRFCARAASQGGSALSSRS